MEFINKLFIQAQSHLKGLTRTQRWAVLLCLAFVFVAMYRLVDWAGSSGLEPLLDQPMNVQEMNRIEERLGIMGVDYKLVEGKIMVPAEGRVRLQAKLAQAKLLPKDTSMGFDRLMREKNFWQSTEENRRQWNVAKGNELARVIREFEGVLDARVFIDKHTKRTIGPAPVNPKASVFVKMAAGYELDGKHVFGLANLVAGAVVGLDINKVSVTDATTGKSFNVPKSENGPVFDDIEIRQRKEEYFAMRIRELLVNIPGLLVSVHAELNPESSKETRQIYGEPVEIKEKSDYLTDNRAGSSAADGLLPDDDQRASTNGTGGKVDKTLTEITYDGKVDSTVTNVKIPAYGIEGLTSSINVPRSYLAHIYKINNQGAEPGQAGIEEVSVGEFRKIKRQVMGALAIVDNQEWRVKVDWFHEAIVPTPMIEETQTTAGEGVVLLVREHGGNIGLGVLAVMSLLVMLKVVRKAGQDSIVGGQSVEQMPSVNPLMGCAGKSEAVLAGGMIDEQTTYTRQMIQQVNDMVHQDPNKAVSILRRWIETEQS